LDLQRSALLPDKKPPAAKPAAFLFSKFGVRAHFHKAKNVL